MITLYGTSRSRAARCLVALEELALEYTHVSLVPRPGTDDRRILQALNPNEHIPVIDDDGLVLWESIAINLYLGDRYGGALWPLSARERATVYQWGFWVQTEVDRPDWQIARRSGNAEQIAAATAATLAALGVLDAVLAGGDYLLGDTFTLADLNVAASMRLVRSACEAPANLLGFPYIADRCKGRATYCGVTREKKT